MDGNKTEYIPDSGGLLRQQLQKPLGEMDPELIRRLLNQPDRQEERAFVDDEAVCRACEKFRQDTAFALARKRRRCRNRFLTAASAALAVGLVLFSLPGGVKATNLKTVLSRWTDSIFSFFAAGESPETVGEYVFQTDDPGLQKIYEAVTELGITDPVVPMWLPEGFEVREVKNIHTIDDAMVFAYVADEKNYICLTLTKKYMDMSFQYEKDIENVEIVEVNGIEHYCITNKDSVTITWIASGLECVIITDCEEEEIYRLLESIYTPEG